MNGGLAAKFALLATFMWPLVACVVEAGVTAPVGIAVTGPPPRPVLEVRPPAPPAQQVAWIPGYWHWSGMQYTWIPGHWEAGPPGAVWRAPHYSMREGTYFYEPGGWTRR